MRRSALCLVLILGAATTAPLAAKYATENVFLCVMDGVRYSETFGDPKHENIPHIWNDLRPQGTVYTNFLNTGVTITRQGHSTLATGTWQTCPNGGPRMNMPSMFDYYRDELGVPQPKTWALFGKGAYSWAEYSSFPAYRDRFKPSFQIAIGENSIEDDKKVLNRVLEVMDKDHPSLVFVNFGYTDHAGHVGSFENYKAAIRNDDEIFLNIWQKIQSDPVYKNKTTLILVNDHGRHDDAHGGFKAHGDSCEGCQHIMLVVLGPDIKKGAEIDRRALEIDIAPTIGELMGFQTPLAKGEVLSDCLMRFDGVNKKEARTETAKRAVEMQKLAERDLVKVVANRLTVTMKPDDRQMDDFGARIALAGLLAVRGKLRGGECEKFVDEWISKVPAGDSGLDRREFLRAHLGLSEASEAAEAAGRALSLAEGDHPDEMTPAICALAAKFPQYKARAAEALVKYVSSRADGYDPELACYVIQTAAECPGHTALEKESIIAAGYMLGQIPECGGLANDPADSGVVLQAITLMRRLSWWRGIGTRQAAGAAMPNALQGLAPAELRRLAQELGDPGIRAPRRAFMEAVRQKGRVGFAFSMDLLKYSVDKDGSMTSRNVRLACGTFLLLSAGKPAPGGTARRNPGGPKP